MPWRVGKIEESLRASLQPLRLQLRSLSFIATFATETLPFIAKQRHRSRLIVEAVVSNL